MKITAMKHIYPILIVLIALTGCNEGTATFTIHSKNYGQNAVIGIYDPNTNKPIALDNINNGTQELTMHLIDPAYAILRIGGGSREYDFWVYLKKGTYVIDIDGSQQPTTPVISSPGKEGAEFIDFYRIKTAVNKTIEDSLSKAKIDFDNSTAEDVNKKAEIMGMWSRKSQTSYLEVIHAFAKEHPGSMHTPFLLQQFGQVESEAKTYAAIFEGLDEEVKNSRAGQHLLGNINVAKQMIEGSTIPVIEGTTPEGKFWKPEKFLKNINVIICWTADDSRGRRANPQLVALYNKYKTRGIEFIGISYDKNRKWWTDVIRDDRLNWPQFNDLKGAASANAKAFSNRRVPYMVLTDKRGKILVSDVNVEKLDFEIESHLPETKIN
jgi:hypothetical protein